MSEQTDKPMTPESRRYTAEDRVLQAAACEHADRTGGNDYQECNACGLMWDYRRGQAEGQLAALRIAANRLRTDVKAKHGR